MREGIEERVTDSAWVAVHTHRVRYHEADAQGFLFNSRYLELADVAMTEYFRSLGFPYPDLVDAGMDPSVVSAELQFRTPARFEDVLSVSVACLRVGKSSFALSIGVRRAEEAVADIRLTYVNVEPREAVSRPIPSAVADALRRTTPTGS